MDSANSSGGIATFLAALRTRLTGRRPDAPEPVAAPPSQSDLSDEAWAHGNPLPGPIPPPDLLEKMSDAEQAEFWDNWATQATRAGNEEAAGEAALTAEAYRRKVRAAKEDARKDAQTKS